ncbi:MAG: molybdenum cofactor guanylyltransferase [Planctomycetota bacterium]
MTNRMEHLPVFILAGGHSRRFGSDKALAKRRGEIPSILYLQQQLIQNGCREESIFAITGQTKRYSDIGIRCLPDAIADAGPMGGVLTALQHMRSVGLAGNSPYCLLLSCDLFEIPADWISALMVGTFTDAKPDGWTSTADPPIVVLFDDGHCQPFPSLVHMDALPLLHQALASGDYSLQRFYSKHREQVRRMTIPENWPERIGFNTPDELILRESGKIS